MHYFCFSKNEKWNMEKVIHVHLIFEKIDRYFGSIAAIYTVFTSQQIGVKYNTLRNAKWKENSVYQTQRAIIKMGEIFCSSSSKGSSHCTSALFAVMISDVLSWKSFTSLKRSRASFLFQVKECGIINS